MQRSIVRVLVVAVASCMELKLHGHFDKPFMTYTGIHNSGRTGNQLFMIAAGVSIAERYGYQYCHTNITVPFDDKYFKLMLDWGNIPKCPSSVLRNYKELNLDSRTLSLCNGCGIGPPNVLTATVDCHSIPKHNKFCTSKYCNMQSACKREFKPYQRLVRSRKHNIILSGYGQQYSYLDEIVIRSKLRLSPAIEHACLKEFGTFKVPVGAVTVAVHARATDAYESDESTAYYARAIQLLSSKLKVKSSNFCFILKTDNQAWATSKLEPLLRKYSDCIYFKKHTVTIDKLTSGYGGRGGPAGGGEAVPSYSSIATDLCEIAQTDHIVLSAGTFGYVGALLGRHRGRLVLYDRYRTANLSRCFALCC
jgi:hypothetical protein